MSGLGASMGMGMLGLGGLGGLGGFGGLTGADPPSNVIMVRNTLTYSRDRYDINSIHTV